MAKGGIEPPTQAFQVARDFSIYTLAGLGDHGPRGQEATIEAFQQIGELGVEAVTPIDYRDQRLGIRERASHDSGKSAKARSVACLTQPKNAKSLVVSWLAGSLAGRFRRYDCVSQLILSHRNHARDSMANQRTPFDSIEGSLEYLSLLREAVQKARIAVGEEVRRANSAGARRRLEALQLVNYKLDRLGWHVDGSHRLLNDLRKLRRLLLGERQDGS